MTLVRRAAGAADLEAAYALRHEVFVVEQGVPVRLERDDLDVDAVHVVAVDPAGAIVGAGRYVLEETSGTATAHFGRLAVRRSSRGAGVGAALVAALESLAREAGLRSAVLDAQILALGFYERLGYAAFGPPFDDAGIEHVHMHKPLH